MQSTTQSLTEAATAAAVSVSGTRSGRPTAFEPCPPPQSSSGTTSDNKTTYPSDRKNVQKVTLFIENGDGVAFAVNNEIHVNANYLGNYTGDAPPPGGLIEGIADFVRLKANFIPSHWVKPGQGDRWDQGYDVTARFLEYCDDLRNGFVAELNKKMRSGYNAPYFVDLLGKNVDQAKYGN
ncbi:hypothetical protein V6N12_006762 [Hibiscus sabdariffa]|uniref:Uncharacterized protein n=1 Tax=Hibiscus sabdariffa TaxID=183260 RepID=A0ABR2EZU0_9ROSI